jgi:hypothetical protein
MRKISLCLAKEGATPVSAKILPQDFDSSRKVRLVQRHLTRKRSLSAANGQFSVTPLNYHSLNAPRPMNPSTRPKGTPNVLDFHSPCGGDVSAGHDIHISTAIIPPSIFLPALSQTFWHSLGRERLILMADLWQCDRYHWFRNIQMYSESYQFFIQQRK